MIVNDWCIFFLVFPRRLNIKSRRFGTFCRFHFHRWVGVRSHLPTCEDGTDRVLFRNVGFNIQTPGKYPEENIPYLQHCESLKTTITVVRLVKTSPYLVRK
jgi:hypothetical protein